MSTLTRTAWTAASVAAMTLLLSACGGSGNAASPTSAGSSTTQADAGQRARPGGTRPPGVSGLVAAVDGRTLQVQGTDTQTSVTWTSSTRFTREAAATAAAVVVGSCVIVRSAPATGTGTADPAAAVAATSVVVSVSVGGECTGGFARGGAGPGDFAGRPPGGGTGAPPGTRASRPSGAPSGGFGQGPAFGGLRGAFGRVTAVTAAGFTVVSTVPDRAAGPATSTSTAASTATTRTVTVTTSPGTTYTRTVTATATAAAVGTCVTAQGPSDDTGAVQATSIAVRPAVDGACSQGFGRGQGAPAGGPNG